MATSVGIYDDESLAMVVQSVELLTPWVKTPVVTDFIGETKPFKQVPLLSWVVNLRETEIRQTLSAYLGELYPNDKNQLTQNINNLPDAFVNNVLANLGYGITTLYQYSLLPRIDNVFSPSIYGVAALWVGYHLFGALQKNIGNDNSNDGQYRNKQLSDLIEIVGYTLRTILTDSPLTSGKKVIVSGTINSEERNVLYVDNTNLGKYIDAGNSLNTLVSRWISEKYNPSV